MSEQLDELIAVADTVGSADRLDLVGLVKMNRLLHQAEGRLLRSLDLLQQVDLDAGTLERMRTGLP